MSNVWPGRPFPLGPESDEHGTNFSLFSEHAERVVGFMIYELHKTRLHILNFAVASDVRRRA